MPRPVLLRCRGTEDYSIHCSVNANGLAPKHASRRESPNGHLTTPPRGKGAEPRRPEPKSRRRHSNSSIPWPTRNPAPAQEAGPRKREASAGVETSPRPGLAEVPAERVRAQVPDRGKPRLPPVAGAHKQVGGPRSHPRAIRPGLPMSKRDQIVVSYTLLLITLPRKKFHI
jgi:hypothetical protein